MVAPGTWEGLRAEALAKVLLTRTHDLDIVDVPTDSLESGYDLLARARVDHASGSPLFAVEVKG